MRVARRLILIFMVGTVLVLAVAGTFWARREAARAEADTREDLLIIGKTLRPALVKVWQKEGAAAALAVLDYADQRIRPVDIAWEAGVVLPADAEATFDVDRQGEVLQVFVPVRADGVPGGSIRLSQSLQQERAVIARGVRTTALVVLAAAVGLGVLSLGAGAVFVGRPLRKLAGQAQRVGEGDLSARSSVVSDDEIGDVAKEMDRMCERLGEGRHTLEQLRHAERLATVGQLAAGVAHELGTPLNVVVGRAKMIAVGEHEGEHALASARIIAEQGERMVKIIRHLLDFARQRGGAKSTLDLVPVARRTAAMLEPLARRQRVTLVVDAPSSSVVAWVDPGQMAQVFSNLLVNAIHAMPQGGTATIRLARESGQSRIDVIDAGTGINEADLPHVFEPFFTTKGVGEGTGLGLSVAHGIIHEHGGTIEAQSEVGRWSRFTVRLPPEKGGTCVTAS